MAYGDPGNFFQPSKDMDGPRGTSQATMEPIPAVQNLRSPPRLEMPRIQEGVEDKTLERAISGGGRLLGAAAAAFDEVTQLKINKELTEGVDRIRGEFGVDKAVEEQGKITVAEAQAMPAAVGMVGERLATMTAAHQAGKMPDSLYYARMETYLRQVRSQYPGYRDIVDKQMESKLGTNPANALRRALHGEAEQLQSKLESAQNRDQAFLRQNIEEIKVGRPDLFERVFRGTGPYKMEEVYEVVGDVKAKKFSIESQNTILRNRALQREDTSSEQEKTARMNIENFVNLNMQPFMSDDFMKNALSKKTWSEDELLELRGRLALFKDNIQAGITELINQPRYELSGDSLAKFIKPEIVTSVTNRAMTRVTDFEKVLTDQNTGVWTWEQKANHRDVQRTVSDLLKDQNAKTVAAIKEQFGDKGMEMFMAQDANINKGRIMRPLLEYWTTIGVMKMAAGKPGATIKSAMMEQRDHNDGKVSWNALTKTIDQGMFVLKTPDLKSQSEMVKGLYNNVDTPWVIETAAKAKGWRSMLEVYHKLFSEDATKTVKGLGTEDFQQFKGTHYKTFQSVFKTTVQAIHEDADQRKYIRVSFDMPSMSFKTEDTPEGVKQRAAGFIGGLSVLRAGERMMSDQTQEKVEILNGALKNLQATMKAAGDDPAILLPVMFKNMGADFSKKGDTGSIWGSVLDFLEKNEAEMKAEEEKKKKKE
jgi:hypothetical protein